MLNFVFLIPIFTINTNKNPVSILIEWHAPQIGNGSAGTLTNLGTKKQVTYQIVSEKEANLKLGKISVTSPVGKGLLGKVVGDIAEVQVPAGLLKFKVEEITI